MMISKFVLLTVALLSSVLSASSTEYYTSPSGRASALGTLADPLGFTNAISVLTSPVKPGDTLWVRGGTYTAPTAGFVFSVSGRSGLPVIFRNYNGERAILDGTFKAHGAYVYYWGLEFTDQSTPYLPVTWTRSQKEAVMLNGSYPFCAFYLESAPNSKFINNVFHDTFGQIEYGVSSSNSLFYGNIVMNLGEQCSDTERGVGIYTQNKEGTRELTDNIVAQNILNGIDVWSSGNSYINNYTLDGNICFNNGYGKIQGGRNMLTGAGNGCTNLLLVSNVLYYAVDSYNRANLLVGHGGQSYAPRILNNLAINGGFELTESFGPMQFTGNELLSSGAWNNNYVVWPRDGKPASYVFSNNKYYGRPLMEVCAWVTNASYPNGSFLRAQTPSGWPGWQQLGASIPSVGSAFRPDADSLYTSSKPSGTRVILRPNRYEAGRAHIAILNFDLKTSVEVDLSSLGLPPNTPYELHPVQNLYNQTNTGVYTGGTITVPMTGWGQRQPASRAKDITSTFPQFGAFLLVTHGAAANTAPAIGLIPDSTLKQGEVPAVVSFTVSDLETPAGSLGVGVSSDNAALIAPAGMTLGGSGGARTLTLAPSAAAVGTARITVTADDGLARTTRSFSLTVTGGASQPPTILSIIPSIQIPFGGSSAVYLVALADPDTAAGALTLTAASSNPTLVPASGILLGGAGLSRTIKITPASGATGSATITLRASDGVGSALQSFRVTVNGIYNTPPTITSLPDVTLRAGTQSVGPFPFTVGDAQSSAGSLIMGGFSTVQSIVKNSSIVFGGSGAKRTVTISPVPGQVGGTLILLWVSDGQYSSTNSLRVTVLPPTAPPVIAGEPAAGSTNVLQEFPPAGAGEPAPIRDAQVAEVTSDSITLDWTTEVPATSQVEYGMDGVFDAITVDDSPLSQVHRVTVTALAPNRLHVLRALSTDAQGVSSPSGELWIHTLRPDHAYLPLDPARASLEAPMALIPDPSGAAALQLGAEASGEGRATWNVQIPIPGTYYVWGRVLRRAAAPDAFMVAMDGALEDAGGLGIPAAGESGGWSWVRMDRVSVGDPASRSAATWTLSAGNHSLTCAVTDSSSIVRRLLLTNDPGYLPPDQTDTGEGQDPATLADMTLELNLPPGWSLVGNPLSPPDARIAAILPAPRDSSQYVHYDPAKDEATSTVFHEGAWTQPDLTFAFGEVGFVFNAGSSLLPLVVTGAAAPGEDRNLEALHEGGNLLVPRIPFAGKVESLLRDFRFAAGDRVLLLDPSSRDYRACRFSGTAWDVIPTLNVGEAAILHLEPR